MTGTLPLVVSEVFGPTVQGEGPTAGQRAMFLRLGLCNLDCSWCDTPYTWDWTGKNGEPQDRSALERLLPEDVADRLRAIGERRLVVTGGEPLLQQASLLDLLVRLRYDLNEVEVETNGTIMPSEGLLAEVDRWNVSPKLPHSGVDLDRAWDPEVLGFLVRRRADFLAVKVVCRTAEDVEETALQAALADVPPHVVWIMPEGRSAEDLDRTLELVADAAIARGFNLTTRLHVHAWGDRRGV